MGTSTLAARRQTCQASQGAWNTLQSYGSRSREQKNERGDLHVVWLDLTNAYGSIPNQLIKYALDFFYIPVCICALVTKYFEDIKMCCTHQDFTTGWQQLEVGIAMGCSISPILFVAAFEVILMGARVMVGGMKLPSGQRLPPWRGYMDDITTIIQTAACTTRLLKRIDELVGWARIKIKPTKSCSLSLRKGVRRDYAIFVADSEEIPLLANPPVHSLGRTYTADLSDRQMGETVRKQLAGGLARINQSQLPGKYMASEDERSPLLGGSQDGWASKLIHQEVAGSAEMPIRRRPLWQEHTQLPD